MLSLFRKNLFIYNVFLVVYCLILRHSWYFSETSPPEEPMGLLSSFILPFTSSYPFTVKTFTILLIFYQAVELNRLVSINRILPINSLFPGTFYILLGSFYVEFLPLSGIWLGNTFLLFMLQDLFKQTKNEELPIRAFNMGFYGGLASLFYFPYIILPLLGVFGIMFIRAFKAIDYIRIMTGIVVPYFLTATVLFMFGDLSMLWDNHFTQGFGLFDFHFRFYWKTIALLSIFGLLILFVIGIYSNLTNKVTMPIHRKVEMLYWMLMVSIAMLFIIQNADVASLTLTLIPLSILVAAVFLILPNEQFAEVVHFILFGAALGFQYTG